MCLCQRGLVWVSWVQMWMCMCVCACGYMLKAVLIQQNENKSEHGYMVHLSWQSCYTIPVRDWKWHRLSVDIFYKLLVLFILDHFHLIRVITGSAKAIFTNTPPLIVLLFVLLRQTCHTLASTHWGSRWCLQLGLCLSCWCKDLLELLTDKVFTIS